MWVGGTGVGKLEELSSGCVVVSRKAVQFRAGISTRPKVMTQRVLEGSQE